MPPTTTPGRCCVVGGGPAGMMAGLLLARQGVEVTVLEKHGDFLRDFRGDTVHPSTLQVFEELGMIDEFLRIKHSKVTTIRMETPTGTTTFADFSRLRGRFPYVAFMPQWDLLDFLARKGRELPAFRLVQNAEVTDLIREGDQVRGVRADTPDGPLEIRADLVLACDGRHSTVRRAARLPLSADEVPMDVLWFRVSREPDEADGLLHSGPGYLLITIDRDEYWQVAYVIPRGTYDAVRAAGLDGLRDRVAAVRPGLADRLERELTDWDQVKLLNVRVDRLRTWYRPGLLCIGDAAHAMSPAGGVGINLAVQDAVAAARMLGPVLRAGRTPTPRELAAVQRRRMFPVKVVQAVQVRMMGDLYPREDDPDGTRGGGSALERSPVARMMRRFPFLTGWTARFIGWGLRPEHVN
ncbi:FAD-dependent oxidoreductase [Streptomyces sp. NPDC088789]|uniref:FAD-dependent oxidoreductase n=1 Tax=Streptomyces sp. NPDC088789 TaxID=3365899 RepID=UPI0037F39223